MAKPFGVGDVVGGRYRITYHVVTSADQDIVFQAHDEALGREVSVLLASRSNAKQVATSARELAAGDRASEVEVLDLGLADDRTYLISTLVDPNQLLDLVVPDVAPFVEPYFTDSLGSEIFGQSREMQPQTFADDAEYYARLHETPDAPAPGWARRRLRMGERRPPREAGARKRPAFLDKAAPASTPEDEPSKAFQADLGLLSDLDEITVSSEADGSETLEASLRPSAVGDADEASTSWATSDDGPVEEPAKEPDGPSDKPAAAADDAADTSASPQATPEEDLIAEGEEVIDNPPEQPDHMYSGAAPAPVAPQSAQAPSSFADLLTSDAPKAPKSFPSASSDGSAAGTSAAEPGSAEAAPSEDSFSMASLTPRQWVSAGGLLLLVIIAAVIIFAALQG